MASGAQKTATGQAQNVAGRSQETTNAALHGSPTGPFGTNGLTPEYQLTKGLAQGATQKGMETGGYDPDILAQIRGNESNLAISGGLDPAAISRFQSLATSGPQISQESTDALKGLIAGGGLSPESSGLYKRFINTGGFTDAEKQQYLTQATSGVKGTYNNLVDQVRRTSAATGGLGGGAAAIAQMARQGTQAQSEATQGALADVNSQIRANELKGAAGLDEGTKNVLAATQGLTQQDILREQGQVAGAQGLLGQAGLKTAGTALQQQTEGSVASNKFAFTSLMNLMGTEAGQQILSMLGIDSSNQQAAADQLTKIAAQGPGILNDILASVNAAANLWSAFKKPV